MRGQFGYYACVNLETSIVTEAGDNVNYRVADRDVKYYIFDWDDNILHMPTHIHLERRTELGEWEACSVSTSTFARIRGDTENYRPPGGDWDQAFHEFRDWGARGGEAFLEDTRKGLAPIVSGETEPAPSFERFKQALIEGRLFAIVTARGHSPESLRTGVEYFIDKILGDDEKREMMRNLRGYQACFEPGSESLSDEEILDSYLSLNKYHAITSPHFREMMGDEVNGCLNQERAKQLAIRDFVRHVLDIVRDKGIDRPVSIGFSDDDIKNVSAVEEFVREELGREYPHVRFVVYDTSDPAIPAGRKMVVQGQLKLGL